MTIGVCGPLDLKLLDWELKDQDLPETNSFPLPSHFINALLKRGFKVVAYTNSPAIKEPVVLEGKNLTVCIARTLPQPGRRFFRYEINDLAKQIEQYPCDFISAFWSYEYAWAALKSGIPTVVNLHDVALQILLQHRDMFRLVRWVMNYYVVSKNKYLVANSSYTYNMLDKKTKSKTVVINNFYPSDLEKQLKVPDRKQNYVVSVSMGFSHRKNISTALLAFAEARKKHPNLEYHLLGADMQPGGLAEQFAIENGIQEGVKFLGVQPYDIVLHEITHAKALLHPAREESFGMVILEAMVAHTPVIAGAESGYVPTLLDNGKAGLLCNINSSAEIADCICNIIENENHTAGLVAHAFQFARNNYSEDVIIEKHLAYFSHIYKMAIKPSSVQNKVNDSATIGA